MIEYVVVTYVRGQYQLQCFLDFLYAEIFLLGARLSGATGALRGWPL